MICEKIISCFSNNNSSSCKRNCATFAISEFVVAEENSKKYCLHNIFKQKIGKFHVDEGCITNETDKKCDYLIIFESENEKNGIFIELKGTDCYLAVKQIQNTLNIYGTLFERCFARIVCRSCPKAVLNDANTIRLKKQLLKHGGNLIFKSEFLQEKTTSFAA